MKIKPAIYENLTHKQRIIASVEAEARQDIQEVKRLVKSCPKKSYSITDPQYSEVMDALMTVALYVECDLRGHALLYVLALKRDSALSEQYLQNIANTQTAWHEKLKDMGINPKSMKQATAQNHPTLEVITDFCPPPELEQVKYYRHIIDQYFDAI